MHMVYTRTHTDFELLESLLTTCKVFNKETNKARRSFQKMAQEKEEKFQKETTDIADRDPSYFNDDKDYLDAISQAVKYRKLELGELMNDLIAEKNRIGKEHLVKARDEDNNTLLHRAIQDGLSSMIEFFVELTPTAIDLVNRNGFPPLHLACMIGRYHAVKSLLGALKQSNGSLRGEGSPRRRVDVTQIVNATPDECTGWSQMAMNLDPKRSALHMACEGKCKEENLCRVVEELILHNANLAATDSLGWTALHLAAMHGKRKVVDLLLLKGQDQQLRLCDHKNNEGKTALHLACEYGNLSITQKLTYHMIPESLTTLEDKHQKCPLRLAQDNRRKKVVEWITDHLKKA